MAEMCEQQLALEYPRLKHKEKELNQKLKLLYQTKLKMGADH